MVAFSADGGLTRKARLDAPAAPVGRRVPLIVALHFSGGTGAQMAAYTRLSPVANKAGFAVVYPTATKADHVWRLRDDADGAREVGAIGQLLDTVADGGCFDTTQAFVTGVSNGGGMAAKLACALSTRIRAIAAVAPGLRAVASCPSGPKVGILEVHGMADNVVPFAGAGPSRAGAVRLWLNDWTQRDSCGSTWQITTEFVPRARIVRETHQDCGITLIRLTKTDHGWPGGNGPFPRHDPTGFDTTREVVRFFQRSSARKLSAP